MLRRKLVLVTLASLVSTVVVWAVCARGISALRASGKALIAQQSTISRHLDADMMHDALRADVMASILATTENDQKSATADIADHARSFRRSLELNLEQLPDGPALAQMTVIAPTVDGFILEAERIAALAATSPGIARAALPAFLGHFGQLETEMAQISATLMSESADMHAAAEASGTAAQRTSTIVMFVVIVLLGVVLVLGYVLTMSEIRLMADRQALLAQVNADIEHRVQLRTVELATANDLLAKEMNARLVIEAELRNGQKLEAVGRLAAGVAHEINTPVQFVHDSLCFVRDAVKDLFGFIEKLDVVRRSVLDGAPSHEAAIEAAEVGEAVDLPYLTQNIPSALERTIDGLDRIAIIVRSMKEFAHPGRQEMTTVDLNRSIESTLIIARNEYKYVADLETDLGELPEVLCHIGDLNQAVLNIIVNAAHAISDVVQGTHARGAIRVRTYVDGDDAVVTIEDTGGGIPEAIRARIFDPFFTTKEIGRGTGQGLSIAHAVIVQKHRGRLSFETQLGKGTTFFIRLPINGRPTVCLSEAAA